MGKLFTMAKFIPVTIHNGTIQTLLNLDNVLYFERIKGLEFATEGTRVVMINDRELIINDTIEKLKERFEIPTSDR